MISIHDSKVHSTPVRGTLAVVMSVKVPDTCHCNASRVVGGIVHFLSPSVDTDFFSVDSPSITFHSAASSSLFLNTPQVI